MKKVLFIFCLLLVFLPFVIKAEADPTSIYFFYGDGCPHCAAEEEFLNKLETEYGEQIKIHRYETWYNKDNVELLEKFADAHGVTVTGVPVTFIGQQGIIGFDTEETTGDQMKQAIDYCIATNCVCPGDSIVNNDELDENAQCDDSRDVSTVINLPFIGERDLAKYSLPVLSVMLGAIDGFNPCAMWVLMFLITLLIGMKSRARMWLLGSTFILASGAVYFLFMSAWLNFLMSLLSSRS